MPDNKYTVADLLWEATRRNKDYKNDYALMLEKYRNSYGTDAQNVKHLPYANYDKWKILLAFENGTSTSYSGWLDPNIEIDGIKRDIESGAPALSVHPYEYFTIINSKKPYTFFQRIVHEHEESLKQQSSRETNDRVSENIVNPFFEQYLDKNNLGIHGTYICINKQYVGDSMLCLIDPMSSDEAIKKVLQDNKKRVRHLIKKDKENLKQQKDRTFCIDDIDFYIGWLRKYDEWVNELTQMIGEDQLTYKNGVVIIPNHVKYKQINPATGEGTDLDSNKKVYKDALTGAVRLIQTTPNIYFSPSRTPR